MAGACSVLCKLAKAGGHVVKLFRIAETASKIAERTTFTELLAYTKQHASKLDGMPFYRTDRAAARNLLDYVELERLEGDYATASPHLRCSWSRQTCREANGRRKP